MRESRLYWQPPVRSEGHAAPERGKNLISKAVVEQGHTDGYGALLHLVGLMELDPETPKPRSDEERANWQGHFEGLRAALLCLTMHERELDPESAAVAVDEQLELARAALERLRREEDGV